MGINVHAPDPRISVEVAERIMREACPAMGRASVLFGAMAYVEYRARGFDMLDSVERATAETLKAALD